MQATPAGPDMRPAPSTELMQQAYTQMRQQMRRPGFPPTFQAAMATRIYRICITGLARNLSRAQRNRQRAVDLKRAAANDKD